MKKIHTLFVIVALVIGVGVTTFVATPVVSAEGTPVTDPSETPAKPAGGGGGASASCANAKDCILAGSDVTTGTGKTPLKTIVSQITNILLFAIGVIAVIMLIIGGIRYTVSGGDSAAISSAKNTILYAIVGIVIAILAYAIVNFVVGSFT